MDYTLRDQEANKKIQARWEAIKEIYRQQLPGKIQELQEKWSILKQEWNQENLKSLERSVHNLTGSGATFGYPDISNQARELEAYLREKASAGDLVSQEIPIQAMLDKFIALLCSIEKESMKHG